MQHFPCAGISTSWRETTVTLHVVPRGCAAFCIVTFGVRNASSGDSTKQMMLWANLSLQLASQQLMFPCSQLTKLFCLQDRLRSGSDTGALDKTWGF